MFLLEFIFCFQFVGKEIVNDFMADKWQKVEKIEEKVNEYTMYLRWKVSSMYEEIDFIFIGNSCISSLVLQ